MDFQGDWKKYHKESKDLYVIEPVIESLLQLLVQSILLYVVLGPGESNTSASEDDTIAHICHFFYTGRIFGE